MSEPKRGTAQVVAWKSPEDQAMSLTPVYEAGGKLDVEIFNGSVTMRGKHCRIIWTNVKTGEKAGQKMLDDVDITVHLSSCQINWKFTENQSESKSRPGAPLPAS